MANLSNLIAMICDGGFVSEEDLIRELSHEFDPIPPLQAGVEGFLCKVDLLESVQRLVGVRHKLADMAREIDGSCPLTAVPEIAARKLLAGLGLILPRDVKIPLSARYVENQLSTIRNNLDIFGSTSALDASRLRGDSLNAWSYVEYLLRGIIGFYASLFETGLFETSEKPLDATFAKAKRRRSLVQIVNAMSEIEENFNSGPIELGEQAHLVIGRKSSFESFNFKKYINRNSIKIFRNFFAHKLPDAIEAAGQQAAKEALDRTIKLVKELQKLNIAPSVVFVTAHGKDEYEREVLWWVDEDHIHLDLKDRRSSEFRVFKREPETFEKLKPHLTVAPAGKYTFDPPLVPMDRLEKSL